MLKEASLRELFRIAAEIIRYKRFREDLQDIELGSLQIACIAFSIIAIAMFSARRLGSFFWGDQALDIRMLKEIAKGN